MLQSIFADIKKSIFKIQGNIKYLPLLGPSIFDFNEYLKYLFIYKKYLKRNLKYKNLFKGQRCFVIGNGPSLKDQDLSLLKNENVITVNSMSSEPEFNLLKPKFHVIVDELRFNKDIPELYSKLESLKNLRHKPTYLFPVEFKEFVEGNVVSKGLEVIYVCRKQVLKRIYDNDFTKRVPYYPNVANAALSLAIYLGFSEIYLLGCDMTNVVKVYDDDGNFTNAGYFYSYKNRKTEAEKVRSFLAQQPNEGILATYSHVFKAFRFLNIYANRVGIKIFNATKGGTLDVFPRVKYLDLFKSLESSQK